jgi:hypothetical protein
MVKGMGMKNKTQLNVKYHFIWVQTDGLGRGIRWCQPGIIIYVWGTQPGAKLEELGISDGKNKQQTCGNLKLHMTYVTILYENM